MSTKAILVALFSMIAFASAGIYPAVPAFSAAYVAPYASTYNAHVVNHAVAAPVAAPLVAAHHHAYTPTAYAAYPHYAEPLLVAK